MHWKDVGVYSVEYGKVITVYPREEVDARTLSQLVIGLAMAFVLFQRKTTCTIIHGSAFSINSQGVIVAGRKGQGKSTLVAAMLKRGARLIADDMTAIIKSNEEYYLPRGGESIRLWPDAIEKLGMNPLQYPLVHSLVDKRLCHQTRLASLTTPLRGIIVLSDSKDQISLCSIPKVESFLALSACSYFKQFVHALDTEIIEKSFLEFSEIASRKIILTLKRPKNHQLLDTVCETIEDTFR